MNKLLLVCMVSLFASVSAAQKPVLICYTSGPTSKREAMKAIGSIVHYLEEQGSFEKNSLKSHFVTSVDECEKQFLSLQPALMFPTLEVYLKFWKSHKLQALVSPKMKGLLTEQYHMVVRKGRYDNLTQLKGKTVGGSVVFEKEVLQRLVFENKFDPQQYFKLKPNKRALSALRKLVKEQLDAVMINEQQFRSLKALPFYDDLQIVYNSPRFLTIGLAANTDKTTNAERTKIIQALKNMCTSEQGKNLCALFGIDSFEEIPQTQIASLVQKWQVSQ